MIRYLANVAKVLDVTFNVLFLFDRHVQTLSRRAGLARDKGRRWGCVLCRVLDAVVPNHCTRSVEAGEIF